ncbi:MAG: hypothetical protein FWD61_05030 [Phycisphaerales bacterium]|nr:hypothetical protein [Phycisphaerales bacterium]
MMIWLFGGTGIIICLTLGWIYGLFCGTPLVMFAVLFFWFSGSPTNLRQYSDPVPWKHCGNGWNRRVDNSDCGWAFDYYFFVTLLLAIGIGSWAFLWLALRGEMIKEAATYVFLPFVIGGVTMLVVRIVKLRRLSKFGPSVLELTTFPGAIGGQLAGVIYTHRPIHAADGYHLRLRCRTGRGILWEDQATKVQGVMEEDASRAGGG